MHDRCQPPPVRIGPRTRRIRPFGLRTGPRALSRGGAPVHRRHGPHDRHDSVRCRTAGLLIARGLPCSSGISVPDAAPQPPIG
ncbi:hypothetical protein CU044_3918 [Streptomyces sp. L-9-10]|nr:hypothetical protein CU044_3918 [Streptomyces sp. L-9-10]